MSAIIFSYMYICIAYMFRNDIYEYFMRVIYMV